MPKIEPVPGDPSTEPVATAQQSHVDGRVGPPTIAQDAAADHFVPQGVEQVEPGTVLPADYPATGGVLPGSSVDQADLANDHTVKADAVPGSGAPQSQSSQGPETTSGIGLTKSASKK